MHRQLALMRAMQVWKEINHMFQKEKNAWHAGCYRKRGTSPAKPGASRIPVYRHGGNT
jgi:hypothetical protein